MNTPAELRRRAAYLHTSARNTADPALARLLTVRALRLMAQANRAESGAGTSRPVAA